MSARPPRQQRRSAYDEVTSEQQVRGRSRRLIAVAVVALAVLSAGIGNAAATTNVSGRGHQQTAVFRPAHEVSAATLRSVAGTMSKRLSELVGHSATAVVRDGDVVVSLGNVSDPAEVLTAVGATGDLYFRPVLCLAPAYAPPEHSAPMATAALPSCTRGEQFTAADFSSSASAYAYPAVDAQFAAYPTTSPSRDDPTKTVILAAPRGSFPASRVVLGPAEVEFSGHLHLVTGAIIQSARATVDTANHQTVVVFNLTQAGSIVFNHMATDDYGIPVADDLNGQVESAPIIEAKSFPGSGQISGDFSSTSAKVLAAELNWGPLPVPVVLES